MPYAGRFVALTLLALAAFAVTCVLAEQSGIPPILLVLATGFIWTASIAITGLVCRTPTLSQWRQAGRPADALALAMNNAAIIIPGVVFLLLPGLFFVSDPGATALLAAIPAAAMLSGVLINPGLRTSGANSALELLEMRFSNPLIWAMLIFWLALVAILLLWAELDVTSTVARLVFGIRHETALISAMILVGLAVIPGGARSVLRLGALAYVFLAAAFLAPLVWIATSLTGLPLPQFSFGFGALADIATLENAMKSIGIPLLDTVVSGGPAPESRFPGTVLTFVSMTIGLCALPAAAAIQQSSVSIAHTRRANGWTLLLLGLVLSAIPAAAAFAKLSLYNSTLGLTTGEVAEQARWILLWGNAAALSPDGHSLVSLCGKAVTSAQSAIDACGGNPDHSITPNDLSLRIEAVFLALPQAAGLPVVFFLFAGLSVIAASLATANATLFGAASLFCGTPGSETGDRPRMQRLFSARLGAFVIIVIAGLLAGANIAGPIDLFLWAIAICTAVLAPVIIACLWLEQAGPRSAIAGLAAPMPVLAVMFWLTSWLETLPPAQREQMESAVPVLELMLNPVSAGLIGLAAAILAMAVTSRFESSGKAAHAASWQMTGQGPTTSHRKV